MYENKESKPSWFDIPRSSPAVELEHNGELYTFDYFNTTIFYFAEQYRQFNHLFHEHEGIYRYIFDCVSMMGMLHDYGFPSHYAEWPSEDDVEAYIQAEIQELDP
ncbi:MAG TPA: hypothetical protein VMR18_01730 [Candidatus Saccharimonadales bacterium]|nr:hypothetical protein [Candidatus Saccharimonadales bacterium]